MDKQVAQIRDGMEMDGVVPGRGPYEAIVFRYRPAIFEDVCVYQDAGQGKKRAQATIKLLMGAPTSPCLRSWDLTDSRGEPIPITEATLKVVPPPMLDKMLNIVAGYALTVAEEDEKN